MNESNRRIASLNHIDELNQQVASQNDQLIASWAAKTVPREPKTPSRRLKSTPRPSKEGPRAPKSGPRPPQDGPRTPPGALLGPSWSHLGTIRSQDRNPDPPRVKDWTQIESLLAPNMGPKRPQDDPKTSQQSIQNMHHFFVSLGPVLDRS